MPLEKEDKIRSQERWYRSGATYTALCVSAWFVLNMTIANLNKWIYHRYAFRYSAMLTALHMLVCCGLSAITLLLRQEAPRRPLSLRARRAVTKLSLVFVISVCCGNAALQFIHVSFSQAIGATAPLWTVVLSIIITRRSYPPLVWASLTLICLGMVLTIKGEINFHPIGMREACQMRPLWPAAPALQDASQSASHGVPQRWSQLVSERASVGKPA